MRLPPLPTDARGFSARAGSTAPLRRPTAARSSRIRAGIRLLLLLLCIPILAAPPSLSAAADKSDGCDGAMPLGVVNLNPFHLVYGPPASHGACILASGSSELIASFHIASHMTAERSGSERMLTDGETYRQALAVRQGFGTGWEGLLEISVVSHVPGVFDRFIENWHSFFGLPQGGRDIAPHDRLRFLYVKDGAARVDLDDRVSSIGDITLGLGYALNERFLANDGLALRGAIGIPTGDDSVLTGSGGLSASIWAETSGRLPGSGESRAWLYGATLGALLADPPDALDGIGGRFVAFGRLGLTWRPWDWLALTTQVDLNSTPYGESSLAPLAGPAIMLGFGGRLRLASGTELEIAIAEDDGWRRSVADFAAHVAIRWRH